MRFIVTGGAGYIGSVVTRQLVEQGHQVLVLDNLSQGHRHLVVDGAEFLPLSLTQREPTIKAVEHWRPYAIIHLAAHTLVGESIAMPHLYLETNLRMLTNLLAARNWTRFVYASSANVYAPGADLDPDASPLASNSPYGDGKAMGETILRWMAEAQSKVHISLRFFNVCGGTHEAHDPETHLIPLCLRAAETRTPIQIFGNDYPTKDGTCIRDYVHVEDVARAVVMGATGQLGTGTYNVATTGGISIKQIVRSLQRLGVDVPYEFADRRPGDPHTLTANKDRLLDAGWVPQYKTIHEILQTVVK